MQYTATSYNNFINYRYGFNGIEKDDEVKGEGNSYTTEFRQYDPRLGRWLTLDPLMAKFPWQSPYVAFDNSPIYISDPNGLEGKKSSNPNPKRQAKQRAKEEAKHEKMINKYEEKFKKYNSKLPQDQQLTRPEFYDAMVERYGVGGGNKEPKWLRQYVEYQGVSGITGAQTENVTPYRVVGSINSCGPIGCASSTNITVPFNTGYVFVNVHVTTNGIVTSNSGLPTNVNVVMTDDDGVVFNVNIPVIIDVRNTQNQMVVVPFNIPANGNVQITFTTGVGSGGYVVEFRPDNASHSKPTITTEKDPQYKKRIRGRKIFHK